MRNSRQFNKRIDIYQTQTVSDGFGGNTIDDVWIASSWAKVETMGLTGRLSNRTTDLGISETNQGVLFTLRKRNDLPYNSINQYILYRGIKYIINSFPDNVNFNDAFIEILATTEAKQTVSDVIPVGAPIIAYNYVKRVEDDGGAVANEVCLLSYIETIL